MMAKRRGGSASRSAATTPARAEAGENTRSAAVRVSQRRDDPHAGYNLSMKTIRKLTAVIEREDDVYVALCPELDIASQGDTVEAARKNLIEALELFFESADPTEVSRRMHSEVFVTRVEIAVG